MGTYTTNYNLFMPSIGEQGWGELVNGNFTTIDTTMDGLNTRVRTLETNTDAIEERVTTIEENIPIDSNGDIVGNMVGKLYVRAITSTTKRNGDHEYANCPAQTVCSLNNVGTTTSSTGTVNGYSKITMSYPYQLVPGIYITSNNYFTDNVPSNFTATFTFTHTVTTPSNKPGVAVCYLNGEEVARYSSAGQGTWNKTFDVKPGDTFYMKTVDNANNGWGNTCSVTIPAHPTYYISVV